jgi:hypothetical protein
MKVWIVYEGWIEDTITKGVFSSLENAQAFLEFLKENETENPYYIQEYEIDEFMKEVVK